MDKAEVIEPCDHAYLFPINLGDYVECETCGLIFPRKLWGTFVGDVIPSDNNKDNNKVTK